MYKDVMENKSSIVPMLNKDNSNSYLKTVDMSRSPMMKGISSKLFTPSDNNDILTDSVKRLITKYNL